MQFFPELHYFFDTKDFPIQNAMKITALKVCEWSHSYKARLLTPKKGIKQLEKVNTLSQSIQAKTQEMEYVLAWIFAQSEIKDCFSLQLISDNQTDSLPIFDHPDDTCCWTLSLTDKQFIDLQHEWSDHDLPTDLFYQCGKEVIINPQSKNIAWRVIKALGYKKIYTPKQFEAIQKRS